ncbi:hypothetical protein [Paenibacillus puerhi]|uniref:hypothetical protein n=1 Tax=Paenibacillus puerhi TaxID=2692622 RepID=UPI001357F3D8|nr:hypothetical protein [Paenibacillus puerhi]
MAPYEPVSGSNHFRLYNGTGETSSAQYVISEKIPVIGGQLYTLEAMLRYTLNGGGHAEMSLLEVDASHQTVNENHVTYDQGNWKWHDQMELYSLKPETAFVVIRFGVGGEEGAYLDIDNVSVSIVNRHTLSYVQDSSSHLRYIWDPKGRLVKYDFDANGNTIARRITNKE